MFDNIFGECNNYITVICENINTSFNFIIITYLHKNVFMVRKLVEINAV